MRATKRAWVGWGLRLLGPLMLAVVLLRLPRPGEVFAQLGRADLALVALTLAIK